MITHEVTVWCNFCNEWEQGADGLTSLWKELRKEGWHKSKNKHVCRDCWLEGKR